MISVWKTATKSSQLIILTFCTEGNAERFGWFSCLQYVALPLFGKKENCTSVFMYLNRTNHFSIQIAFPDHGHSVLISNAFKLN